MIRMDVVIAGAGPVGLMLACELGLAGIRPLVLERRAVARPDSPGMAINATTVELLDRRGLADRVRAGGLEWPQAHFAHLMLDPARLRERHASTVLVPQAHLESCLEARARELGAEIRRDHEVTGVRQDGSGVTVHAGGDELSCRYLVGCDGANSVVRRLAGIPFPGVDAPFHGIVAEVDADGELMPYLGAHQYPGGVFTVGPSGPGLLRVSTGEFGVQGWDDEIPATVDEIEASIARLVGHDVKIGTPHWLARWHNVTRHAERYRAGRVFVAGDAAHVHFPLGGQALSTGVEDAVNLGWKLAADLAGRAPAGLLDSYHRERHPVGARACLTTRAQVALMHPLLEVSPLREVISELIGYDDVNEHLVRMAGGLDVTYAADDDRPLVGRRFGAVPLSTPDGVVSLAEVSRAGRGLLLDLSAHAAAGTDPGVLAAVSGWSGRIDVVVASPTTEIPADRLLLRPDGRVAWTGGRGDGVRGLKEALLTWFGDPAA
jgi:2-polyprenyl-6-methoxyphenol hydroxylase-like FAD-dependent oxidoreductase